MFDVDPIRCDRNIDIELETLWQIVKCMSISSLHQGVVGIEEVEINDPEHCISGVGLLHADSTEPVLSVNDQKYQPIRLGSIRQESCLEAFFEPGDRQIVTGATIEQMFVSDNLWLRAIRVPDRKR